MTDDIKKIFRIMGVKPVHIILPIIFSLIISLFGGITVGLLIPIAKGIANNNFSFVSGIPVLKHILSIFPQSSITTPASNRFIFVFLVGMIFIAAILKNVLEYARGLISDYWNGKFFNNLNIFIFNRYISFGKLFFDRISQGYLSTVLSYGREVLTLLDTLQEAIRTFFTLAVYFTIMILISWKLTIFTLTVFPVLYYSLRWIIKKLEEIVKLSTETNIQLQRNLFNILSCIPLIKAYTREEEVKKRYADMRELLRKINFRAKKVQRLTIPTQEIIILIALLTMVSFVAFVVVKGQVAKISTFIVFLFVVQKTLPMFRVFNSVKISLAQVKPPLREILKILDDKDKFYVVEGKEKFRGLKRGIELNHLNFSYMETVQVLKDVIFSIEKSKMTAIVGPTGAGKTTLISLILRFYDCGPQTIKVDGIDIRDFTLKSLRTHMALVSQDIWLFNDTIKNNIMFGIDGKISDERLVDIAKKTRLHDFIMKLPEGFDTLIGDRGIRLSGGEKQRLSIARALLKGSEILILDEATSSLDTRTERLIQEAIDEAVKDRTAIVIAHRLSTIKSADKVVVIESGKLIEQGPLKELLDKKGTFYRYWEDQKFY